MSHNIGYFQIQAYQYLVVLFNVSKILKKKHTNRRNFALQEDGDDTRNFSNEDKDGDGVDCQDNSGNNSSVTGFNPL